MIEGHDPYLVALSLGIAMLGGYTGFGLAANIRGTPNANYRLLLASAATFLAIGIWTMHFIGILAAPIPADTVFLILPTIISFLICALVVGISLFFVSIGEPSQIRVTSAACLLGAGISSMHYVGIHGLAGNFAIQHSAGMTSLSVLIAIVAAYGGLRVLLSRQIGLGLALSAVAFGFAVSGMHYTAMHGMTFVPKASAADAGHGLHAHASDLVASQQILSLVVALLCFVIAAGFLLLLVPDPRRNRSRIEDERPDDAHGTAAALAMPAPSPVAAPFASHPAVAPGAPAAIPPTQIASMTPASTDAPEPPLVSATPADGKPAGETPRPRGAYRMPVESADGTQFLDTADIRSVKADAHYTRVHDGVRERMCPWSISEAEAQLDPDRFVRVHRSYIIALAHVALVRREGDGAVVELDGPTPHRVPVSRARIAELKSRLGLTKRHAQA